mgnify:CR=1 FL=1
MKTPTSISDEQAFIEELRTNPDLAAEYLQAAIEDEADPRVLLIALRQVAEAHGGVGEVARRAGLARESLYRTLSARGNPRLSTLLAITKAMGLKITVEAA